VLTEEQVETLAETDLHAALVQPNASVGLLMNCLYSCLETIQRNPAYPLVLLENLDFARMVLFVIDARKRLVDISHNRCEVCKKLGPLTGDKIEER
jgi:hypothetical protein